MLISWCSFTTVWHNLQQVVASNLVEGGVAFSECVVAFSFGRLGSSVQLLDGCWARRRLVRLFAGTRWRCRRGTLSVQLVQFLLNRCFLSHRFLQHRLLLRYRLHSNMPSPDVICSRPPSYHSIPRSLNSSFDLSAENWHTGCS